MYVNTFISLEENVGGYGKNQKHPSGHVTITSPGVVKCYIQDLGYNEKPYVVYLVSKDKNKAIRLGVLNDLNTTKQTTWKTGMNHIQGTEVSAQDVDCVIVVVEGERISNTDTVLVGYANGKYLATSMLEKALPKVAPQPKVMSEVKVEEKVQVMVQPQVEPEPEEVEEPVVVMDELSGCECDVETVYEEEEEPVVVEEEKENCGFQVKDGKVQEQIVEQIKEMMNGDTARSVSKEELEQQIRLKVDTILEQQIEDMEEATGEIEVVDEADEMDTLMTETDELDLESFDIEEDVQVLDESVEIDVNVESEVEEDILDMLWDEDEDDAALEPEVSDDITPTYRQEEQVEGEDKAFIKDIERVLYTMQDSMQRDINEKKKEI